MSYAYVNAMRILNIIEELQGSVSTKSDVSVKSVKSVVSVVRGLFYYTIWYWKMSLAFLVLWALWLLWVLWALSDGVDTVLNL